MILDRATNVLSAIHPHVYFPTYSNGLKEIGRFLGFERADEDVTGLDGILWRKRWEPVGPFSGKAVYHSNRLGNPIWPARATYFEITSMCTTTRSLYEQHSSNDSLTVVFYRYQCVMLYFSHHQVVGANVVEGADVGMIQGGNRPSLLLEPLAEEFRRDFDSDLPPKARVLGSRRGLPSLAPFGG